MTALPVEVHDFLAPTPTRAPAEPPARIDHALPAGTEVPLIAPGSDEWFTTVSASKIAAITGQSPYDSPFSLWHKMAGLTPREAQTAVMMRGHYLEPAVAAWFRDQHPTWVIRPAGTFVAATNPRHTCSPDRCIYKPDIDATDLLQIKSTTKLEQWGRPGTDEIPPDYRAQVMWEMHVAGASRTHVAIIGPYLDFDEYVIDYEPVEAARLVKAADEFLALLDARTPPSLDSHGATFDTLRELHPDDAGKDGPVVDIDENLARRYVTALAGAEAAKEAEQAAKSELLAVIGDGRHARWNGKTIATRRPARPGARPTLFKARSLPTFTETPGAASPNPEPVVITEPEPATDEPVHIADVLGDVLTNERTDWIRGRMKALDPGPQRQALARFWPTDVPKPGQTAWTHDHITAIGTVITAIENSTDAPFPPTDPAAPTATDLHTARIEATTPTPLPPMPTDTEVTPTKAQLAEAKAALAGITIQQRRNVIAWGKAAKTAGRPFTVHVNDLTVRTVAITKAAAACIKHLLDNDHPDDLTRAALAHTLNVTVEPHWPTGALIGTLTAQQATQLESLAVRYSAGDDEATRTLSGALAAHYAALNAASQPSNTTTKENTPS